MLEGNDKGLATNSVDQQQKDNSIIIEAGFFNTKTRSNSLGERPKSPVERPNSPIDRCKKVENDFHGQVNIHMIQSNRASKS